MSNAKNDFVLPIVVLTVICIVVSLALAFTEQATAPIIAAAEKAAAEAAEREVLPSADSFELVQATGLPDGVTEVYPEIYFFFVVALCGTISPTPLST